MRKLPLSIPHDAVASFCQQNRIRRFALFGSVLRSDFGADSDLDVLVEFAPDVRIGLRFFALQRELSRLFGRDVDLHTPGFISRRFREQVLREAEDVYVAA